MGSRHWPTRRPSARMAALAGNGFGYSALDSKTKESSSSVCPASAPARSPAKKASTTVRNCGPIEWAATLTTPMAPTESRGSVMLSSPLYT